MMALSNNVLADTSGISNQCSVLDKSDAVVIMVCSTKDAESLRQAAEEACGLAQLCNVWIWDDETKAPRKAPKTDADIPKINSGKAIAVWANDSKMLMSIKQVEK